MAYIIAVLAFALAFVCNKKDKLKKWWLIIPFMLIGACSFANTGLGVWIANDLIGGLFGMLGGLIGVSAMLVGAIVALIMAIIVVYDIAVDHKVDKPALVGMFFLPLLFLVAAGPIASAGATFSDTIAEAGTSLLSGLLGG